MLSQFYPPVNSGEERHEAALSNALARRAQEVSVISLPHLERSEQIVEEGVTINSIQSAIGPKIERIYQQFSLATESCRNHHFGYFAERSF